MRTRTVVAAIALAALGATTEPATRPAGPRPFSYAAWAGFKPGSAQTLAAVPDGPATAADDFALVFTLTAVKADTVELTEGGRRTVDGKPVTDSTPASVPAADSAMTKSFTRTGTRDVTAAGRTFGCDVWAGKGEWGPCSNDATFTIYTNGDAPGGVVEMTVAFDGDERHTKHVFRLSAYTVK